MPTTFRAWDGEGQNDKYVLLMCRQASWYSSDGLTTEAVLEALWEYGREPHTTNVLFGMGYDVNMWLRDLTDDELTVLLATNEVDWHGWHLSYIARKIFTITHVEREGKATFYDVWGYYQSSFVTAVREHLGVIDDELSAGKAGRADFATWQIEDIKAYTTRELEYLEALCARLQELVLHVHPDATNIPWYGPGALANYVYKSINMAKQVYGFRAVTNDPVMVDAFSRAYFGGRIELLQLGGFAGPIYRYDLHSAYPASAMWLWPCTSQWLTTDRWQGDTWPFACYKVTWELPEVERSAPGPFPFRDTRNEITFPRRGRGYYWYPEIKQALARWGDKAITVGNGWLHRSTRRTSLREYIPWAYAARAKMKREGDPGEFVLKLELNSFYGKLAQEVGSHRYSCLPLAGYITSQTRAWLLQLPTEYDAAIIGYATDAIFSTRRLPLKVGPNLGEWEETEWEGATFIEPGIYQLRQAGKDALNHTRGYPVVNFDFEALIDELNEHDRAWMTLRLFVGHQLAMAQHEAYGPKRLTFTTERRDIAPYLQTKRVYDTAMRPGHMFGTKPITDWRMEHRASHMRAGMLYLSQPRPQPRPANDAGDALQIALLDAAL